MQLEGDSIKDVKANQKSLIKSQAWSPMKASYLRWVTVALACNMMFGFHVAQNFPSYLKSDLKSKLNINNTQFGLFFSIYSLPNIIVTYFGGFMIDKLGVRISAILFILILITGQLTCAISVLFISKAYIIMLCGRFIFAFGGDNLGTAQNYLVNKWFFGQELAFAFGILLSIGRLGSAVSGIMLPAIYDAFDQNLFAPIFTGVVFLSFTMFTSLIVLQIDKKAEQEEKYLIMYEPASQENKQSLENMNNNVVDDDDNNNNTNSKQEKLEKLSMTEIKLNEFKNFEFIFWLIAISCVLNYICLTVFLEQSQDFFEKRYSLSNNQSSFLISLPYWFAAALTPFIGLLIDKVGNRHYFILMASILIFIAHLLWIVLPQCPNEADKCNPLLYYFPLFLMGIFYSSYAAVLWPCIPLLLKKHQIGMGFGVVFCIQNFGLFIGPIIVGQIQDKTVAVRNGFFYTEIFYLSCAVGCIITSIFIIIYDRKTGNRLKKVFKDEQKQKISTQKHLSMFGSLQ